MGICGTQIRSYAHMAMMFGLASTMLPSYALLTFSSYKVILKIRSHNKTAASSGRSCQFQSRLIKESREIIIAVLIISAIPLSTQLPTVVLKLLQMFLPPFNPWLSRAVVATFPAPSAANAYVTAYRIKDYRKKIKEIFRKKSSHSQLAQAPAAAVAPAEVNISLPPVGKYSSAQ